MKSIYYILFTFFFSIHTYAQKDSTEVKEVNQLQIKKIEYNPLSPSKAAFYSAIFPGAGQIYNNRYWWQLPLIYGGLGVSIYYYIDNSNEYDRYRTAYKRRLAGLPDEFTVNGVQLISSTGLESAQKQLRKNRDLSLLSTVLIYVLQIVEASVTAHLIQFDTNDNLTISPTTIPDYHLSDAPKVGVTLKYSF
ncbi:DUF5683 domain-containing protein [Tenacibaculum sp. IB213877]|uniref:DUF5683 domain-containing protein n=1 Tax=Tenacibaculum sp. IB213877 TaxID=3097351 RepID=UPI002A59E9DA|nr:DUF5683 domain-containing protein [Tenacibaculum sp. IB213877]MDY0781172.1 DUF5683 domain-containing protein [Tenacibaculum sp. IB213877]